jgi:L-seryl-tRNA(Ser) seleniumtransferase
MGDGRAEHGPFARFNLFQSAFRGDPAVSDQLACVDGHLGGSGAVDHVEPGVEAAGSVVRCHPTGDEDEPIRRRRERLDSKPFIEGITPFIGCGHRPLASEQDAGLFGKLAYRRVPVGPVVVESHTVGNVDFLHLSPRKDGEIAEEPLRVALDHEHLETSFSSTQGEDGGGGIRVWHPGDGTAFPLSRIRWPLDTAPGRAKPDEPPGWSGTPGKLKPVSKNPYRDLPSVDVLAARVESTLPRAIVADAARAALDQARVDIANGEPVDPQESVSRLVRAIERSAGIRIINASGVLLHTNLGRAPWSSEAIARAAEAAAGYSGLEIDLDTGERTRRGGYAEGLLRKLTGAEAALVVNNNAAALLLTLGAIAVGRAVPVARGELIEIGGSYRLPDVIAASRARLIEVGTTNRTRPGDYQTAIQTHDCGAILKVHPSNYRIEGFTEQASVADLARLAASSGLPLINDLGSGLLDANASWLPKWLHDEPGARQALADGAGLVTFSGDKLLGGPQAGIILGSTDLVDTVRSHPLTRALRVDGVTYAALAATLEEYVKGKPETIPFWRSALLETEDLEPRCARLAGLVGGVVEAGASTVGAGSAPGIEIPGPQVRLVSGQGLYECLLAQDRPVLTRRDAGDLVVDLRAVDPTEDEAVAAAISRCR